MIKVIAKSRLKPDVLEAYCRTTEALIQATRAEDGCISYELCRSMTDPRDVAFIECWESREALEAHMNSEHFRTIVPQLGAYREGSVQPEVYEVIG